MRQLPGDGDDRAGPGKRGRWRSLPIPGEKYRERGHCLEILKKGKWVPKRFFSSPDRVRIALKDGNRPGRKRRNDNGSDYFRTPPSPSRYRIVNEDGTVEFLYPRRSEVFERFYPGPGKPVQRDPMPETKVPTAFRERLEAAMTEGVSVLLVYQDVAGRKTKRRIRPEEWDGECLVIAFCELREEYRSFRLDRILDCQW